MLTTEGSVTGAEGASEIRKLVPGVVGRGVVGTDWTEVESPGGSSPTGS